MGRPWQRKAVFDEDGNFVLLKRLSKIGNGYALFIPKEFITYYCHIDQEGQYWVKLNLEHEKESNIRR